MLPELPPWSPAADILPISRRVPRRLVIVPYRIAMTHLQPHSHLPIYTAHVPTVSSQIRAGWPYTALHISTPSSLRAILHPLSLCALCVATV